jgi:hypothetical protein
MTFFAPSKLSNSFNMLIFKNLGSLASFLLYFSQLKEVMMMSAKPMVNRIPSSLRWNIGGVESGLSSSRSKKKISVTTKNNERYVLYTGKGPRIILIGRYVLIDHVDDVIGGF